MVSNEEKFAEARKKAEVLYTAAKAYTDAVKAQPDLSNAATEFTKNFAESALRPLRNYAWKAFKAALPKTYAAFDEIATLCTELNPVVETANDGSVSFKLLFPDTLNEDVAKYSPAKDCIFLRVDTLGNLNSWAFSTDFNDDEAAKIILKSASEMGIISQKYRQSLDGSRVSYYERGGRRFSLTDTPKFNR